MVIQNFFKKLGFYLLILLVLIFTLFPFVQMLSTSLKHQFDWGNPSLIPVKVNLNAYEELLGFQKKDIQVPESIKRLLDNPKLSEDKKKKIILKFLENKIFWPWQRPWPIAERKSGWKCEKAAIMFPQWRCSGPHDSLRRVPRLMPFLSSLYLDNSIIPNFRWNLNFV